MPDPVALSQSPRTQSFQAQQQTPPNADDIFIEGFTQMAYDAISKNNPLLMKDIITFRVLDVNSEDGSGVGTFILAFNQEIFYIPVVISENAVKPMDMFYSRRLDKYYPLSQEWLIEANKSAVNELGQGVKPPDTLQTDVDIRGLVVPPMTGRYSYAALQEKIQEGKLDDIAALAFKSAVQHSGHEDRPLYLPSILARMPRGVKVAFINIMKKRPKLTEKMAQFYGVSNLKRALQVPSEKTAMYQRERPIKHDLYVASMSTPLQELQNVLGPDETPTAYKALRMHGFYVKDSRPNTKELYVDSPRLDLTTPGTSGLYRVYTTDGKRQIVLVLVDPKSPEPPPSEDNKIKSYKFTENHMQRPSDTVRSGTYLVLFPDGRMLSTEKRFVAEQIVATRQDLEGFVENLTTTRPQNGDHGVFICATGGRLRALGPVRVSRSRSTGDTLTYDADYGATIVISNRLHSNTIVRPGGTKTTDLSGDFRWFKATDHWVGLDEIYTTPDQVLRAHEAELMHSATPMTVKKASHGARFFVGKETTPVALDQAVYKIASLYNVSAFAAVRALDHVFNARPGTLWAVKTAQGAPAVPPQDPSQMIQDPSMMPPPPAPPPPTGMDLAISEQMQVLQQQAAAIQQQMGALQTIQQRAQQIDMGGGAAAAPMGAASMTAGPPQSSVPGIPAMAPTPEMQQGAPPGMAPGAPPQGMPQGAQPGMPPQPGMEGQPPQPGMEGQPQPGMEGQPQPGMEEEAGGAGQMPYMTNVDMDSGEVEKHINPDFLDQAGELEQADVFDAAAIASIAKNKNLRSFVQAQLPTAEKTIDNLGRMLLLFYLRENKIKPSIGNETYSDIVQNLRDVFEGLGDLWLKINQSASQLLPAVAH